MKILSFVQHHFRHHLARAVLAGALCAGVVSVSHVALAQETEVEIEVQPPVARVEVIPVAPSPQHFWIRGYWGYAGAAHYWVPGRYEVVRPGYAWSEARWAPVGRRWHFYPGRWYQR
jgi:hypothetical protein